MFFSGIILAAVVWAVSAGVDSFVLSRWSGGDSSVVVVEEVLGTRKDPESSMDGDWESEYVALAVRHRSGKQAGTREEVEIVRLVDSKLVLDAGRSYLMLADRFDDGIGQRLCFDICRAWSGSPRTAPAGPLRPSGV